MSESVKRGEFSLHRVRSQDDLFALSTFYNEHGLRAEGDEEGDFLYHQPLPFIHHESPLGEAFLDPGSVFIYLIKNREGEAVAAGMASTYVNFPRLQAHIDGILIRKSDRGSGLFRLLLNELLSVTRAAGVTVWTLGSKPERVAARAGYEKLGFKLAKGSDRHFVLSI